jgi:hypothetical protein
MAEIEAELTKITDPEPGRPISKMKLIDGIPRAHV